MGDPRPLDGGDDQIRETGNGPTDPQEMLILEALYGPADGGGVYGSAPPVGEE